MMKDIQFYPKDMMIEEWEMWWADVKFDDSDDSKRRPVLVLNSENAFFIETAKVTTHEPRDIFDYQIKNLESCGLNKDSTIRLNKKITIEREKMIAKSGKLSKQDIVFVKLILNRRK